MKRCLLLCLFMTSAFAGVGHDHDESMASENQGISLSKQSINDNQISIATAGPQTIQVTRDVLGKIMPNANKTIYIYPRYDGIIQSLNKQLGDKVEKGDVLATIESDQTLQTYKLTAPFSGYIVQKNASAGEHVTNSSPIYRLSDLSKVWVDLFIYRNNARLIRTGQQVMVYHDQNSKQGQQTTISYVSPLGVEHNQTMLARAVLDNRIDPLDWLPGLYVDTHITIKEQSVPVAVLNQAIQTIDDKTVIFVRTKQGFMAKPIQLGIKGDTYSQVITGIDAGEQYAAKHSFLLKAELEKGHATHSH